MAKASTIQTSFNGGVLSPFMDGRVDLEKYGSGCEVLDNFIPLVQGPAMKRPGTRFVKETSDSSVASRLVPFEFSTTQAYILEFGALYIRVYRNSGLVREATVAISDVANTTPIRITTSASHGYATGQEVFIAGTGVSAIDDMYFKITVIDADEFDLIGTTAAGAAATGTSARVFELVTTYTTAQLEALQFAQSADVLYVAHPDVLPRKITRTSDTAWTIADIDFDWPPFEPENIDESDTIAYSAKKGTGITLTSPAGHFLSGHVGGFISFRELLEGNRSQWEAELSQGANKYLLFTPYGSLSPGDEVWFESNVYEFIKDIATGGFLGSVAPIHREGTHYDGRVSWKYINSGTGYAKITAVTDAFRATADVVVQLPRPYVSPDITITSTGIGANPTVTATAHGFSTGDQVWLQDIATATALNQKKYTITRTGANTFTLDNTADPVDAGTGGIAIQVKGGENQETIDNDWFLDPHRWAFSAFSTEKGFPRTVTFFEDRLWFAGTGENPDTFWGSKTREYEDHETSDADDFAVQFTLNAREVNVIEWIAAGKSLFLGTASAEWPVSGATLDAAITSGSIRAVQHVSSGSKSEVQPINIGLALLFVQRAGRKLRELVFSDATNSYVAPNLSVLSERIALQRIKKMSWQQEPHRIVWMVLENGALLGFTYDREQQVLAWHNHTIGGTAVTVESVATIPHEDGDRDQTWLIVKRTIDGGTKRYVEFFEEEWLEDNDIEDAFYVDSGLTHDGAAVTTISGLDHLEGEVVKVYADRLVQADQTVSGGSITITSASVVQVGLSYEATLQTMRVEAGGADGTAQGKWKRITNIVIRLYQTGVGLLYGPDTVTANMEPVELTAGELKTGDTEVLPWPEGYEQDGRITLRHNQPTPCFIVATMPQVSTQDR